MNVTYRLQVLFVLFALSGGRVAADELKPLAVTVEDSVRLALKQSPDVTVVQSDTSSALVERERVFSLFTPVWKSNVDRIESTAPSIFDTQTSKGTTLIKDDQFNFSSGLYETLPTNTEIFTRFATSRYDSNSADVLVSPYYFSRLEFGGTQPLLRGMDWFGSGVGGKYAEIKIAARNKNASEAQFRDQMAGIISDVEKSYWNLVAARDIARAREEALGLTIKQIEGTEKKIAAGLAVPAAIYEVAERKASRNADLLIAARDYAKAKFDLAGRVNLGREYNPQALEATDELRYSPYPMLKEEILKRIDAESPLLQVRRETLEAKRIAVKREKTAALPSLNLSGTFFLNGGNTTTATGYSSDIDQMLSGDSTGFQMGAALEVPLGPGPELTNFHAARLEYRKAEAQLRAEQIRIHTDANRFYEEVEVAGALVKQAVERVELAKKKLDFEQQKFEAGRSTAFNLLQFQEDLADARVKVVESVYSYQVAAIALDRLIGRTLTKFHVDVAAEKSLWVPHYPQQ